MAGLSKIFIFCVAVGVFATQTSVIAAPIGNRYLAFQLSLLEVEAYEGKKRIVMRLTDSLSVYITGSLTVAYLF